MLKGFQHDNFVIGYAHNISQRRIKPICAACNRFFCFENQTSYYCSILFPIQFVHLSRHDKTNKMAVRPANTQISLGIRPVWSESSLSAWRKLGSLATQWVQSKDSDQTGRIPRLIWVFAGRTCHFVGFVTMRLICTVLEQCFHLSIQHRNATFTSCPHCYINQTSPCSHSSSKV